MRLGGRGDHAGPWRPHERLWYRPENNGSLWRVLSRRMVSRDKIMASPAAKDVHILIPQPVSLLPDMAKGTLQM